MRGNRSWCVYVFVCALERIIEAEKPANLRLLKVNGAKLEEYFAKGDVARVYLNFSDPWPKARHAKRRLTPEEQFPVLTYTEHQNTFSHI